MVPIAPLPQFRCYPKKCSVEAYIHSFRLIKWLAAFPLCNYYCSSFSVGSSKNLVGKIQELPGWRWNSYTKLWIQLIWQEPTAVLLRIWVSVCFHFQVLLLRPHQSGEQMEREAGTNPPARKALTRLGPDNHAAQVGFLLHSALCSVTSCCVKSDYSNLRQAFTIRNSV